MNGSRPDLTDDQHPPNSTPGAPAAPRVLVLEDDHSVREVVRMGLSRAGFSIECEADGGEGLRRALNEPFDMIVLDLMLPSIDGFEVCRTVRSCSQVPIIMLTARTDSVDVVRGLEYGADDYLTKPFEVAELAARMRSVLRRAGDAPGTQVLTVRDVVVDPAGVRVTKAGRDVQLTATEFRLLVELVRAPGRVFTRDQLLESVWGYDYLGDSRLVDMAVKRLREKIEDDPSQPQMVETVRGFGYRIAS